MGCPKTATLLSLLSFGASPIAKRQASSSVLHLRNSAMGKRISDDWN